MRIIVGRTGERKWKPWNVARPHSKPLARLWTGRGLSTWSAPETGWIITASRSFDPHGRFSGHGLPAAWVVADIVRMENEVLAEHWDVIQDEATQAQSRSGLPMFGDKFPA
ncbi:hypothetical protein UP06_23230 [Bradyrhizobium sp. LTSP857]|nr:hypothetical protein UP06_23230 [Bradyrhizobium sp. LTSP857]